MEEKEILEGTEITEAKVTLKYVYDFEEGNAKMKFLLGGKGANLCEMTNLGLPVPPGFVISTEACRKYSKTGSYPPGLKEEILAHLKSLEERTEKKFGDPENPLLVSVRSGAAFSMPGMMDTVLNLGLNDVTVKGLIRLTGDERFACDAYRRFIQMFGNVVLKVDGDKFEQAMASLKERRGVKSDTELTAADLKELVGTFKGIIREETGKEFPSEPLEQLDKAIAAVFESWNNPRAIVYRKAHNIPDDLGTAVNIQTMVFGNMGSDSATGVAFTRDPATGERKLYGEYLTNAQGEDVVAGIRTPQSIAELREEMPENYEFLGRVAESLEEHYRDVQDIEFTIEKGKLYMLQTRTGKRTASAAIKIAVDMMEEGLISEEEAISRIDPYQLDQLLHPRLDPKAKVEVLARGLPASPGAATGKVVFDADKAEELGSTGERVILTRWETTPDDIHGIIAAQGVLTSHGGLTSHAAVVARGMGKPCVCGCEDVKIDYENCLFKVDDEIVREGDVITIDGGTGRVILGSVPLIPPEISEDLKKILGWADKRRRLGVRANADLPRDARKALEFGAEGIGLCRTEHMFFAEDRLPLVRQMILADTVEERKKALEKLLPMQRRDFEEIFKVMKDLPVTIRLLDPPLHEFLPNLTELQVELMELKYKKAPDEVIREKEKLLHKVRAQAEVNPMLGLRGCRLGLVYPEIYEMQTRAIFEAACNVARKGITPKVEVMIPLAAHAGELKVLREKVEGIANEILESSGVDIPYAVGTMIEVPRAAVTADEIAKYADFFSFGTNDLTQTVFGFSRDDAEGKFMARYLEGGILPYNPFEILDPSGVGKLMYMACELGRKANPELKLGICGEHGGEPRSVKFCDHIGLDYVSCSPYRVPLARLAAAQARIGGGEDLTK
ncbi:MAG: pyruvate, phosphate dikinase [Actinomycetota bacterium]|nr:pyruvate, phosphate dikinase [Actinomycetota bacterium]